MTLRIVLILLVCPLLALAQLTVPEHGGRWVHDEAGILSQPAISELESILKAERDSTSNQIAVLIIPSLQDEAIEEYSLRVAEKWGIGQKGKDNGALLLISMQDKRMRIETGYGLEGTLTDAMSSRINRNEIVPRFRQGDYDGGVKAGVIAIMHTIKGEYKNDAPREVKRKSRGNSSLITLLIIIAVIIFLARRRGGGGGGGYWSSGGGFFGGGFGGGGGSSWGGGGGGADFGGGGGFGGGGSSDSW
jgi:uncharacterized protein